MYTHTFMRGKVHTSWKTKFLVQGIDPRYLVEGIDPSYLVQGIKKGITLYKEENIIRPSV